MFSLPKQEKLPRNSHQKTTFFLQFFGLTLSNSISRDKARKPIFNLIIKSKHLLACSLVYYDHNKWISTRKPIKLILLVGALTKIIMVIIIINQWSILMLEEWMKPMRRKPNCLFVICRIRSLPGKCLIIYNNIDQFCSWFLNIYKEVTWLGTSMGLKDSTHGHKI